MDGLNLKSLTLSQAHQVTGWHADTIKAWLADGCPHEKEGRRYLSDLKALIRWRESSLKARPEPEPDAEELDAAYQQARLSKARADDQERKNKEAEGQLIPLDDVIAVGVKVLGIAKSGMNALGARCATKATSDKAMQRQLKAAIDKEVHSLLTQLSEHFGAIRPEASADLVQH